MLLLMLLRGEELRTKSGMGGVIPRLGGRLEGDGLREERWGLIARSWKLRACTKGLGLAVRLFERMRL